MGATDALLIAIRVDEHRWKELPVDVHDLCDSAVRASFISAGQEAYGEVSVLLTNDLTMCEFNSQYRNREGSTNVLAFPSHLHSERCNTEVEPVLWGDIAISFDRVEQEAKLEAKSISDHIAHLVVHGTLHLLGFDHKEALDAAPMERLEAISLAQLGVRDPYSKGATLECLTL